MGWAPKRVLDLGARTGDWTRECMKIYPAASYTLIDAIKFDNLKAFDCNPRVTCMHALVSDEVKECDWYELRNSGDSMYKEVTAHFEGGRSRKAHDDDTGHSVSRRSSIRPDQD